MAMDHDLFIAILAMDSYNRGYDPGVRGLETEINQTRLGNAVLIASDESDEAITAGFYASAYNWNGEIVISYRGTDAPEDPRAGADLLTGWTIGAGISSSSQAGLALAFYQSTTGHNPYSSVNPDNVTITGHSLGGGLAGFVGALSGAQAVGFDHMPYSIAAIAAAEQEAARRQAAGDNEPVRVPDPVALRAYHVEGEVLTGVRNGTVQSLIGGVAGGLGVQSRHLVDRINDESVWL